MSKESLRQEAVRKAWDAEKERVLRGKGTRQWSVSQQQELIKTGKVTGFEGSHILGVQEYPEYAGDPRNIQFLPSIAHAEGVHDGQNYRKETEEGLFDERTGEIIPNPHPGTIPEQDEVTLDNRAVFVPELEAEEEKKYYQYGDQDPRQQYNSFDEEDQKANRDYINSYSEDQSGKYRTELSRSSRHKVYYERHKVKGFGVQTACESPEITHDESRNDYNDNPEEGLMNPKEPREEHEMTYEEPDMDPGAAAAEQADEEVSMAPPGYGGEQKDHTQAPEEEQSRQQEYSL